MTQQSPQPAIDAGALREQVRAWITERWDAQLPLLEWRRILAESGWGLPHWPRGWYGRGLPPSLCRVVADEFRKAGVVGLPQGIACTFGGAAVVEHGSDELRRRFLPRGITGEESWCQLFSEPGAGSDLAGVQTTAVLHGDEWIVNGQKVWTSVAVGADYGILVARTDWDVPKHRGLTYFMMPMKQPGVEVRPLRQMNRQATFNEVFFTDARIPRENMVGQINDGWKVAMTTLAHERTGVPAAVGVTPEARRSAPAQQTVSARQRRGGGSIDSWRGLAELARERGTLEAPGIRQAIVRFYVRQRIAQLNAERTRAARKAGRAPGPESSLGKLQGAALSKDRGRVGEMILGAAGMLDLQDAPLRGAVQTALLTAPSSAIAGGTDEVMRNIIGERILGLPKEPQVDRDAPFREVRQDRQRWLAP